MHVCTFRLHSDEQIDSPVSPITCSLSWQKVNLSQRKEEKKKAAFTAPSRQHIFSTGTRTMPIHQVKVESRPPPLHQLFMVKSPILTSEIRSGAQRETQFSYLECTVACRSTSFHFPTSDHLGGGGGPGSAPLASSSSYYRRKTVRTPRNKDFLDEVQVRRSYRRQPSVLSQAERSHSCGSGQKVAIFAVFASK